MSALRPLTRLAALFSSLLLSAPLALAGVSSAHAAGSLVEGDLNLPPAGVQEPPTAFPGFVDRIKNPITEVRPYDPRGECFVFLEGGPAENPDKAPQNVTLELGPAAFKVPVLPVVVNSTVDVKNVGRMTHAIQVTGHPELFEGPPIGPAGIRTSKITQALEPVVLRSKDTPHLEGRIVGLPTRFFARLSREGSFSISDVPPGRWTVRVWYRDGWLPATQVVEVGAKTPRIKLTLPERLEVKRAEGEQPKAP